MSRGRKPLPPGVVIDAKANHEAIAAASAAVDGENSKRLAHIEELYGDGSVYSLDGSVQKTKFYLAGAAEAMLRAGNEMILIKEREPHGEFLHALERIDIAPRAAQRLMQAAVKFQSPQMRRLATHLDNKTKLIELVSEESQELEELSSGGTLYGLTIDDIDRMPSSQLKSVLRTERKERKADQEANERLIADKNKKIDEYAKRQGNIPDQVFDLRKTVVDESGKAIAAINKLSSARIDIREVPSYEQHKEEIVGAVGLTFLQGLYQIQAYLSEEINWAEQVFSGSKIELNSIPNRGPNLSDEIIDRLKKQGADESARVNGFVPLEDEDD